MEKEAIIELLKTLKPTVDLTDVKDIIDGGYLDSLEFMGLIAELSDRFGIEIDIDEIVPENFNSVDAIAAMISKLKG